MKYPLTHYLKFLLIALMVLAAILEYIIKSNERLLLTYIVLGLIIGLWAFIYSIEKKKGLMLFVLAEVVIIVLILVILRHPLLQQRNLFNAIGIQAPILVVLLFYTFLRKKLFDTDSDPKEFQDPKPNISNE